MAFTSGIKTNDHEEMLLKAFFQNTYPTDFGGTYSPTGRSVFIGLCTADPGVNGAQNTNEAQGGAGNNGYARGGDSALVADFPVTSSQAKNTDDLTFGTFTGGASSETYTHASIGTASTGAGTLYYRATLQTALAGTVGSAPVLEATKLIIGEG